MKKIILFTAAIAFLSACKNNTNQGESEGESNSDSTAVETALAETTVHYYGDTISEEGAIAAQELMTTMGNQDSIAVKLTGVINSSCQKKGCWMKMDLGNGEEMRISFKDYSFFVPKNLDGETAVVEGYAFVDTIDVDFLKHLAEDAGKSEEEIAAINEPEVSVNYVAKGVIIKGKS